MLQQDFSQTILNENEMRLFRKFKHVNQVVLTRDEWVILSQTDLIKQHLGGHSGWFDTLPKQGVCELSEKGIRYREYLKQQAVLMRKETRRFWIPIIVSNLVSVVAIVISIISLMK